MYVRSVKMDHKFLRSVWDVCQICPEGMSDLYGNKETRDDKESLATINLAVEEGINFFNTADYYGMGHNELLLREAMKGRREKFFVSVSSEHYVA
jgi:aryl-alcohol dehydrogenase-like predicted oxidoreductase